MFRIRLPTKLKKSKLKSKETAAGDETQNSVEQTNASSSVVSHNTAGSAKADIRTFTKESSEKLEDKSVQIARECGFTRKRKSNIEDESVLPSKYEPFPSSLYGHPLEEIDNFIYEEVGVQQLF